MSNNNNIHVDAESQGLLDSFISKFSGLFSEVSTLQLDTTWPSIASVDFLTFSLRQKYEYQEEEKLLIRESSAYLATILAKLWSKTFEEIHLSTISNQIKIKAVGGDFLKKDEFVEVNLTECYSSHLAQLPDPFPLYAGFERAISYDTNISTLLLTSVATTYHSHVVSPWQNSTPNQELLKTLHEGLAQQYASSYTNSYPNENLGQVAELYLSRLTFPPLFIDEPLPTFFSTEDVIVFTKEFAVPNSSLKTLCSNLSQYSDENLALTATSILLALELNEPSQQALILAESRIRSMGVLRMSIYNIRGHLFDEEDWLTDDPEKGKEQHSLLSKITSDITLNLIPWISLEPAYIAENFLLLQRMVFCCSKFDIKGAKHALDELVQNNPADIALRIQQIKLHSVNGENENALKLCKNLISEPEAESSATFFNIWGTELLANNEIQPATRYCQLAYELADSDSLKYPEIANNYAWCLLLSKKLNESEAILEKARAIKTSLTILLNLLHIKWQKEDLAAVRAIRGELLSLAPYDRRVIAALSLDI